MGKNPPSHYKISFVEPIIHNCLRLSSKIFIFGNDCTRKTFPNCHNSRNEEIFYTSSRLTYIYSSSTRKFILLSPTLHIFSTKFVRTETASRIVDIVPLSFAFESSLSFLPTPFSIPRWYTPSLSLSLCVWSCKLAWTSWKLIGRGFWTASSFAGSSDLAKSTRRIVPIENNGEQSRILVTCVKLSPCVRPRY